LFLAALRAARNGPELRIRNGSRRFASRTISD
jgi:hypothetical protein